MTDTEVASSKKSSTRSQQKQKWAYQVAMKSFENHTSPILLFDGVCNLCNDAVNFCLDHDEPDESDYNDDDDQDTPSANLRFASLQSQVGQALLMANGRDPNDWSTMVLVTAESQNDRDDLLLDCFTGSNAVLHVAGHCLPGLPAPVRHSAQAARVLVPTWMRDALLKWVGQHRHWLGTTEGPTCRLDLDGIYQERFLEDFDLE
eukprot:CAMPEP_0172452792 /NCGR_PEP_ID=MMETSP1065-20121228/10349_1 /TAXON_ID=265537 /ORGANISM="Amphiprora paludosa, Strain CCMP125" /LENGTH=203 /DNA_ID=CAMNT_0013204907 /DNA_START=517 /DNA_END=1128 /DNA_ORIENTATION=+